MELQFGDADAAEAAYERNIQIRRETNPEADVTDILAAGARTALDAGELDVASRLAERAARDAVDAKVKHSAEKTLADAAWMKVRRMSDRIADLAAVDADPEALGRAAEALDAVLEWQTVELGAIHADRVETLNRMVSVAVMQRDLDRAAQIQQRLVDAYRTATGAASIQTRTALQGLVDIQRIDPERLELAAEANEQLAAAEEEAWGATDSRRRSTLELQLEMLRALKQKKQAKAVKKMLRKLD